MIVLAKHTAEVTAVCTYTVAVTRRHKVKKRLLLNGINCKGNSSVVYKEIKLPLYIFAYSTIAHFPLRYCTVAPTRLTLHTAV
jgi:hypothetical protein